MVTSLAPTTSAPAQTNVGSILLTIAGCPPGIAATDLSNAGDQCTVGFDLAGLDLTLTGDVLDRPLTLADATGVQGLIGWVHLTPGRYVLRPMALPAGFRMVTVVAPFAGAARDAAGRRLPGDPHGARPQHRAAGLSAAVIVGPRAPTALPLRSSASSAWLCTQTVVQTQVTQVGASGVQTMPQPPQLNGSKARSTQLPITAAIDQRVLTELRAAHAEATHAPLRRRADDAAAAAVERIDKDVDADTATTVNESLQTGRALVWGSLVEGDVRDGHRLADPARADAAGAGIAAGPAVAGSEERSRQRSTAPQYSMPTGQSARSQTPLRHSTATRPLSQTLLQAPQLLRSELRSTQTPLQRVRPGWQTLMSTRTH